MRGNSWRILPLGSSGCDFGFGLLTSGRSLSQNSGVAQQITVILQFEITWREEADMASCPECENSLDVELDEVEEGDVVVCDECGTEYEVVGVEPLELVRVGEDLDEDDEVLPDDEEEEE
jgi:alpha-aminoadipate carrier protein LysW